MDIIIILCSIPCRSRSLMLPTGNFRIQQICLFTKTGGSILVENLSTYGPFAEGQNVKWGSERIGDRENFGFEATHSSGSFTHTLSGAKKRKSKTRQIPTFLIAISIKFQKVKLLKEYPQIHICILQNESYLPATYQFLKTGFKHSQNLKSLIRFPHYSLIFNPLFSSLCQFFKTFLADGQPQALMHSHHPQWSICLAPQF